jgi:hypothetical protein
MVMPPTFIKFEDQIISPARVVPTTPDLSAESEPNFCLFEQIGDLYLSG